MTCNCDTTKGASDANLATVDFASIAAIQSQAIATLAANFAPASAAVSNFNILTAPSLPRGLTSNLHFTNSGDVLASTGFASGNEGQIILKGAIGPIPYELHVNLKLDGSEVVVTLEVKKPLPLGPITWRFTLGGLIANEKGDIVGASSLIPVDMMESSDSVSMLGLDRWCVIRCGGIAILKTLVLCLPSLAGGPATYVACVTAKAGSGAAEIAFCIATKCV